MSQNPTDKANGIHSTLKRCRQSSVLGRTGGSSADNHEAPRVHVEREGFEAKFWLEPVRFQGSRCFRGWEIRQIEDPVEEKADSLLEAWHEFFGN
jgi:hypothetical protein